ncbi:hypothetical protein FHS55_001399 [Angulomicrobium tetraedrale]|uniref:Uncharacterized protein n=1 Tax=Ancylobacter tetraedralis TaxID=217068 RepID=A0A839Z261_9HYPH|nr:hypothetical protein [Ancylobacter tetraedralis]MBB3770804.1 hypothetical protein [Ancylobacter tetraedralis]
MTTVAVTCDTSSAGASVAPSLARATGLRKALFAAALAVATLGVTGMAGSSAQAAVAGPALGTALPAAAPLTENVRWVCGPWRCAWRPNNTTWYVPPYARAWGPPVRPNCYWHRNWGGAWVHTCP